MENVRSTEHITWLTDYARLLGSVRDEIDREQYLEGLIKVVLAASGARRGHALLMERDTVAAEAGADGSSVPFRANEEVRKAMARQAMAEIREHENGSPWSPGCRLGEEQGCTLLSISLDRGTALTVCLEGLSEQGDGLSLAVSKSVAAAHLLACAEAREAAERRLRSAEHRVGEIEDAVGSGGVGAVSYLKPVAELERDAIELALRSTKWNKEEAARRLGISRASIYMKVKKFGLQKPVE